MMKEQTRILIVEEDAKLAYLMSEYLERHGFLVSTEDRGDVAVQRIRDQRPDLVVLDLRPPGLDGVEICRQIRPGFVNPILMLTAHSNETDELMGLESGADDFMSKPVEPRLLLARIAALLRLSTRNRQSLRQISIGSLEVDATAREVIVDGTPVNLTTAEFELLWLLAVHAGEVMTRDQICQGLRGFEWNGLDRSVDLRVSRLRRKLGDNGRAPARIKSVRSVGYMLVARPPI